MNILKYIIIKCIENIKIILLVIQFNWVPVVLYTYYV